MARTKQAISFLMLILSLLFLAKKSVQAEPMRVMENLRRETVLLPSSAPDRSQLVLFAFVTLTSEGGARGLLAVYDDPRTKRPADYLELYDDSGSLLLISWIDRFGILRVAMDRGLLEEEASKLEGVLVLLPEGTPS